MMAALVAAVIVPTAAAGFIGMVMRGAVIVSAVAVTVRRCGSGFVMLQAAERMHHRGHAL